MESNIKRINKSIKGYNKAHAKLLKYKTQRMWVEEDDKIHALNYIYYRYFTNRYLNWLREIVITHKT